MGCGKTAVGRVVARVSGFEFLDTDLFIEEHVGMSIPRIFEEHGEETFRRYEREVVTRLAKRALGKVSPLSPVTSPERVAQTYRDNFTRICDALAPMLTPDMNVFTHNPWGEYGHEDHVQIFRALDHLRRRIGFTLWMSNYCTERSLPLAMRAGSRVPGEE